MDLEIVLPVGTEVGYLRNDTDIVTVTVRMPGMDWPHGLTPSKVITTIAEGFTRVAFTGLIMNPRWHPTVNEDNNGKKAVEGEASTH